MGFTVEEKKCTNGAKIKVIGVGGGGCNMVDHMIKEGIKTVDMIIANTDAQSLNNSLANTKIQIGEKKTKGLGAGMIPEVGKESALESYEEIKSALEYADIVFISSGLGGGTGTGAAPIVAQAAKESGALTISVVTKPFKYEGRKRTKLAEAGLLELKKESDSIIVIPNDKLLSIIDKKLGVMESFEMVNKVLSRAVGGLSNVVVSSGPGINLDFADVKTVMSHRGLALMGVGESEGEDSAREAIKNAIESPLLDNMSINGALGVLVHFYIHSNCPLNDIAEAMEIVEDSANEDAHIIWGTTIDNNLENNKVQVTIVATGFDNAKEDKNDTEELKHNHIKERILRLKKVSGGDSNEYSELDIPTYMRHQLD